MTGAVLPLSMLATAGLATVVWQIFFRPAARIKRTLKRLDATPIARAREGEFVKIVGTVAHCIGTVESPMSRRRGAYYSIVVENTTRSPPHEILREERGVDFHVQDESGMALIRLGELAPRSALTVDYLYFTTPVDGDPDIERFMELRKHAIRGRLFYNSLRAKETILEVGDKIAVGGLARWMPDPDAAGGSYREAPMRLVLEASDALPLLLSDDKSTL